MDLTPLQIDIHSSDTSINFVDSLELGKIQGENEGSIFFSSSFGRKIRNCDLIIKPAKRSELHISDESGLVNSSPQSKYPRR